MFLNFSNQESEVWLPFPAPGQWTEQLDGGRPPIAVSHDRQWLPVRVPSNYGAVYLRT